MNKMNWFKRTFFCVLGMFFFTACGKVSESYKTAMELSNEGEYEKAETYFEDAIRADGLEPKIYIGYGMTLNHLSKYEEAETAFSQILKADTDISDSEKKQIYYGETIAFYGQGKYEDVTLVADEALKIKEFSDLDRNLQYTEAIACFLTGQETKAEELCDALLSGDASDMEVYMLYGGMKKASGDTDGAVKLYEDAIRKNKSYFDAYFRLYDCYLDAGQSSAAAELLDHITSIEAKKSYEMIAVGKAWYYKGDYDKALSLFEEAYEEKDADGLFYMSLTKKTSGKLQEAEDGFLSYLSAEKDHTIPEVYNQLAGIYMERSQYEKAQSMISQGLAMGDTVAAQNLLRNQVILLELTGDYDKALEVAEEYRKVYTEDAAMKKEISFIKTRR